MPRFFFDTEVNGVSAADDEGILFADFFAAKRDALEALHQIAGEAGAEAGLMLKGREVFRTTMQIRNDAGVIVFAAQLELIITASETGNPRS